MSGITTPETRRIIEDFAQEIRDRRIDTGNPGTINFRIDRTGEIERPIYRVPIKLLRYRMGNGRIASDVLDSFKNVGMV